MESVSPVVGEVVKITSDGQEISGIFLGRFKVNASSLMIRDNRTTDVGILLTDVGNRNPFERARSFTSHSLFIHVGFDSDEAVYTDESKRNAQRIFNVPEKSIEDNFTFEGIRIRGRQKFVLENNGELVLMEANSVVYDKNGKALLLLTNPRYTSNHDFVAALTLEEVEDSFPISWCNHFRQAPTIEELLNFMLQKHPEGIEPDEIGIKGNKITVEMVIKYWNRAVNDLPREDLKFHDPLGLKGAEHNFFEIKLINTHFGNRLVSLLRSYTPNSFYKRQIK